MTHNPRDKSLAFHLLFPLLGLPKVSLSSPESITGCYLSTSDLLVVEVADRTTLHPSFLTHPDLLVEYEAESSYWLLYSLPAYQPELTYFREGKYSLFSSQAKTLFRIQWSKFYPSNGNKPTLEEISSQLLYWAMAEQQTLATHYWVQTLDVEASILPETKYYLPNPETEFIEL